MVTPVTSSASATGAASKVSSLTSAADQEDRFMKLLVAQMKNQDPLNPLDNAQMTSQIAQINTVGGIEKLNATVQSLLGAFNGAQVQDSANLVGHDVLVPGNVLALAGGKATGGVELSAAAQSVNVDVLGADGSVVTTLRLGASPAGVRTFTWDGRTDSGQAAPAGNYAMRVTAVSGGQPIPGRTLSAAHVQAVEGDASGVVLDLGAAGLAPASAVKAYL